MTKGKVWLVGSGPSDPGLFTIKGKQVLEQAQVVVYDRLAGESILAMIPANAEKIDAGKTAGDHKIPQDEINQILLREAQKGKRVVRLKGGDPFLFGRGGEELELLAEHGIAFEVVPGITSALAVPAYQGIPVTHRDYASSLHIITGHKKEGSSSELDYAALVKLKGTLVFLMGIRALPGICAGLLQAGMRSDMPAVVLERGTRADQRRISANLADLPDRAAQMAVRTPAIIVVGEVCGLADQFDWVSRLPLAGQRIVVTRPQERISKTAQQLRTLGAEVLEMPAISIRPRKVQYDLARYQWLVFTSPAGIRCFFADRKEKKQDIRELAGIKTAVLGPGTGKELERMGIYPDLMPGTYETEALGALLARECEEDSNILIARSSIGNPGLVAELEKRADLSVTDLAVYDTVYEAHNAERLAAMLRNGEVDYVVFTSASTVQGFAAALQKEQIDYEQINAVCIGRMTRMEADRYNMRTFMAEKPTIASVIDELMILAENKKEASHANQTEKAEK